ncbi:uncharacterized protein ACNLHF_028233 [Anomaloglossus baeobatrachus]
MEDVYHRRHCIFGSGYVSYCPSTREEAENQLLIYSTRFLPSPIFNMERLMPTNREAQKKYLPYPLYEGRPEPPSWTPEPPSWTPEPPSWTPEPPSWTPEPPSWTPEEQNEEIMEPMEVKDQEESEKEDTKKTPQQRNEVVISDPLKYREVKDFEEDEKEDTKKKEKKGSGAQQRMVQNTTTSTQNQPAKRKQDQDQPAKRQRDQRQPRKRQRDQNQPAESQRDQSQPAKRQRDQSPPAQSQRLRIHLAKRQRLQKKPAKRQVKKQPAQRQMIRQQSSVFNKMCTNLSKIKNTVWTKLFKAMRR